METAEHFMYPAATEEAFELEQKPGYEFCKRTFDIVVSLGALVVLSPVFLATAIAIKMEDGGPVFFCQTRMTKGAKLFGMYKFRSMYVNAEAQLEDFMGQNEQDGPVFKITNDPRITKVGKFIRRYSIDELPQLINIIKGDMSIIGPRPPLPREVEEYTDHEMRRLAVKTGLACYREVSGRNNVSFERWVEMDLQYIEERSICTDMKIFFQMFRAVLTGEGAS